MAFAQVSALFAIRGSADYIGEPVTQQQHMEQAAALAVSRGARPALVIAALLHDIGHLLDAPQMGTLGVQDHEAVGAAYLRGLGLEPDVWTLVSLHVPAKRYLITTDYSYRNRLSPASRETFERYQGGLMTPTEVAAFRQHPLATEALLLRQFDDEAKVPQLAVPELQTYEALFNQCLSEKIIGEKL